MKRILALILSLLYPCVLFYRDTSSIDLIGHQWFYISVINFLSFFYLLFFKKNHFFDNLKPKYNKLFFLVYTLFIIITIPSFFTALNQSLVVVEFFRILNTFFAIFLLTNILSYHFEEIKQYLFIAIVFLLAIENLEIIASIYKKFQNEGFVLRDKSYQGLTGNINIAAFSILIKVPILYYLYINSKSIFKNTLFLSILVLSLISIYFIQSRASFLALIIVFIGIFSFELKKTNFKKSSFLGVVVFLFLFLSLIIKGTNNTTVIDRFSNLNQDESANLRLRYYTNGLNHLIDHPFYGCGLGNWKIQSIAYESKVLKNYQVSYHMHNDFLQFGAELGIFGFILYCSIFLILLYKSFKIYFKEKDLLPYILALSLVVYVIDAMFNFPFERTISQSMFIVFSSMILALNFSNEKRD